MGQSRPKLLLLGSTGYIGGVLLSNWYASGVDHLPFRVVASGRSAKRLQNIEKLLGISTALVSFEDLLGLEREVQENDIVVQLADCDAMKATQAILRGMKTRYQCNGTPPLLYHASGAVFLSRFTGGEAGLDDEVVSDLDTAEIAKIPTTFPHRNADDAIIRADHEGYIRSYIVVPCAVFGVANGIMHESELANPDSMPIPRLIKLSMERGMVPKPGEGHNQKAWVHVDDVVSLFDIILHRQPTDHGSEGIFFCMTDEMETGLLTAAVAEAFHAEGILEYSKDAAMSDSDHEVEGLRYWACTERGKPDRSRALGWKPKHDLSNLLEHAKDEVKRLGTVSFPRKT